MASRNSFTAGNGRRAIVRSTISPCSLSTMTSKLSIIHGPDPAQEGGALIELKLRCIGTGTTRRARLSENRRDDFTPLDRPYQERAVEYDVFGKQRAHLGGCGFTRFP